MQSVSAIQHTLRKVRLSPIVIGWLLSIFGLATGIMAGGTATRALPAKDWIGVTIGGLLALCGFLGVIAGMQRVRTGPRAAHRYVPPRSLNDDDVLPRLGEILVYKYHLITEKDLQKALSIQKASSGQPLGEILVDMSRITWRDLAKALEDQLSYGDPWARR